MKKCDLNFYGFICLYRLFKDKFSDYNFETSWDYGGSFEMFSGNKCYKYGEIYLEISNPTPSEPREEDFHEFDVRKETIKIDFLINDVTTLSYEINKSVFFSKKFVNQMKKIIGVYPSIRILDDDDSRERISVWAKELIISKLPNLVFLYESKLY